MNSTITSWLVIALFFFSTEFVAYKVVEKYCSVKRPEWWTGLDEDIAKYH